MKSTLLVRIRILLSCLIAAATAAYAAEVPRGEYLDGKGSKVGVILGHGQGGGADSNVVGPLRRALHRELGIHTLSLDLPAPGGGGRIDPATFPEHYAGISAAIDFLKNEKKVERIYLVGYSMSGRTFSGLLASQPDPAVVGFIGIGLWGGGKEPFNSNLNIRKVKVPVLDIFADRDELDVKFAAVRQPLVSDTYKQVSISGASHTMKGYDSHVAAAVIPWLREQEAKAAPR